MPTIISSKTVEPRLNDSLLSEFRIKTNDILCASNSKIYGIETSVQPNLVLGNIFGQSPRPLALRYNEVPLYITCRIILVPRGREKNDVHVESKKFKFSLLHFLTNASVAGISKNLREANETGKECDKNLPERNEAGREC